MSIRLLTRTAIVATVILTSPTMAAWKSGNPSVTLLIGCDPAPDANCAIVAS